ncbi:MAG: hypothetical protein H8D63_00155 [Parcubacteria group bacterium]|nr:hypothetical protein [Parcubacteria group bacterium]
MDKKLLLLHLHAPKKVQGDETIAEFEQFPSASAVFLPASEHAGKTLEGASVWEIQTCLAGDHGLGMFCNDVSAYASHRMHVVGEVASYKRYILIGAPDNKRGWMVLYTAEEPMPQTVAYLNQLVMVWGCNSGKMCLKTLVPKREFDGGIFTPAIPFLNLPSR